MNNAFQWGILAFALAANLGVYSARADIKEIKQQVEATEKSVRSLEYDAKFLSRQIKSYNEYHETTPHASENELSTRQLEHMAMLTKNAALVSMRVLKLSAEVEELKSRQFKKYD